MLNELADLLKIEKKVFSDEKTPALTDALSEPEIDGLLDDAWENCLFDMPGARKNSERALLASNRISYLRGVATALRNKAYYAMIDSDNKRAIEEARTSLNLAPENDLKLIGTLWDILAMSYFGLAIYETAVEYTYKSIGYFEQTDYERGLAWAHHNLALVYKNIGELDKSEKEFLKAVETFRQIDHKTGVSRVYTLLSSIYQERGDYKKAMAVLDEAEKFLIPNEESVQSINLYLGKAKTFRLMGKLDESKKMFETSSGILDKVDNAELRGQYEYEIALLYQDRKDLVAACDHLDMASDLSNRLDSKIMKRDILHAKSLVYEDMGNFGGALRYYKNYMALVSEITDTSSIQKIHNMEVQKEIELAERDKDYHRKLQEETEKILKNVLPGPIVEELKSEGHVKPKRIESATALFTDFVGFTAMSSRISPEEIVRELDYCFTGFDRIMEELGIEKLKTIGDGYMAVAGALDEEEDHVVRCVRAGLRIRSFMDEYKKSREKQNREYWEVRIGIHTGSLIAGVIGNKKFAYDVWGDTVNTASRIESGGHNGEVNISCDVYKVIGEKFRCELIGEVQAKGKGVLELYTVKEELELANPKSVTHN